MIDDKDDNQIPETPATPIFPTDRIEHSSPAPDPLPPIAPNFPNDRIEKGEVPDIKPE